MRAATSRALPAKFLQAYFPTRAKMASRLSAQDSKILVKAGVVDRRAPKLDTRRRSDFAKAPRGPRTPPQRPLWHRVAGVGFDYRRVGGVDRPVGIYVGPEICLIDRCTLLCFRLRDIGRVYRAIAVRVAA